MQNGNKQSDIDIREKIFKAFDKALREGQIIECDNLETTGFTIVRYSDSVEIRVTARLIDNIR